MSQIYDSLKALISQEMISKASSVLDESGPKVSSTASSIIASLMGVMLKKGNTPQIRNILEEAGNLDILSGISNICEEKPTQDQQRIGDDFLQHLLGDKAAGFTDPIADKTGISKVAVNRLVSMIAPLFAGFLGNKLVKDKMSIHQVLADIDKEKSAFAGMIPTGLISSLGLSSLFHNSSPDSVKVEKPVKKSNGWIIWVILLILLLLLLFWWKSCSNKPVTETFTENNVTETIGQGNIDPESTIAPATIDNRESTEIVLPDGTKINAYTGGVEDRMIKFLQSNEYKNASADELKNIWFDFDNIDFKFNSSTELTEGSTTQLNNIVAILKNFKDAKIKIGGYADKVGSEEANKKISTERAMTVEKMLKKAGADNQVVGAEGYGEEFAKYNANAPESERVKDRFMALRFVK